MKEVFDIVYMLICMYIFIYGGIYIIMNVSLYISNG